MNKGICKKILVLGASSYIGRHLLPRLDSEKVIATRYKNPVNNARFFDAVSMDLSEVLENPEEISYAIILLGDTNPETCAQDTKRSYMLNVDSIKRVIDYLRQHGIKPVFASSDFVFDGEKGNYIESDSVNPILIYGKQKIEVERYLQETCNSYIIVRFAKVFGSQLGDRTIFTNWIDTIEQTDVIRCAADQIFSPVYVNDVVEAITRLIANDCEGIFHVCGSKSFARIELLKMLVSHLNNYLSKNVEVVPCSIYDFDLREKRPLNVSMIPDKLIRATGIKLSNIEDICEIIVKNKFESYEQKAVRQK